MACSAHAPKSDPQASAKVAQTLKTLRPNIVENSCPARRASAQLRHTLAVLGHYAPTRPICGRCSTNFARFGPNLVDSGVPPSVALPRLSLPPLAPGALAGSQKSATFGGCMWRSHRRTTSGDIGANLANCSQACWNFCQHLVQMGQEASVFHKFGPNPPRCGPTRPFWAEFWPMSCSRGDCPEPLTRAEVGVEVRFRRL